MALNFKKSAESHGVFTPTMTVSHAKADKETHLSLVGQTVTVVEVAVTQATTTRNGEKSTNLFAICRIKEDPEDRVYAFGGMFSTVVAGWLEDMGEDFVPSDCEALNKEITENGGVEIAVGKNKNKSDPSRSDYWVVKVIG